MVSQGYPPEQVLVFGTWEKSPVPDDVMQEMDVVVSVDKEGALRVVKSRYPDGMAGLHPSEKKEVHRRAAALLDSIRGSSSDAPSMATLFANIPGLEEAMSSRSWVPIGTLSMYDLVEGTIQGAIDTLTELAEMFGGSATMDFDSDDSTFGIFPPPREATPSLEMFQQQVARTSFHVARSDRAREKLDMEHQIWCAAVEAMSPGADGSRVAQYPAVPIPEPVLFHARYAYVIREDDEGNRRLWLPVDSVVQDDVQRSTEVTRAVTAFYRKWYRGEFSLGTSVMEAVRLAVPGVGIPGSYSGTEVRRTLVPLIVVGEGHYSLPVPKEP